MTLGNRLRQARKTSGLSQEAFAACCGVTKKAQINFEKDRQLPGGAYLLKLAALEVDVAWVLTGAASALTPEEAALLDNYRHSDAKRQAQLLHASGGKSGKDIDGNLEASSA